jgi:hypothetical protein
MRTSVVVKGLKVSKGSKGSGKLAHTANTQRGMGDSYGVGIKNPVGGASVVMGQSVKNLEKSGKKTLGKPPKSLA